MKSGSWGEVTNNQVYVEDLDDDGWGIGDDDDDLVISIPLDNLWAHHILVRPFILHCNGGSMNIFFLDQDPKSIFPTTRRQTCRQDDPGDRSTISTAHRVLDGDTAADAGAYQITHKNHPSAIWVRQSADHYR